MKSGDEDVEVNFFSKNESTESIVAEPEWEWGWEEEEEEAKVLCEVEEGVGNVIVIPAINGDNAHLKLDTSNSASCFFSFSFSFPFFCLPSMTDSTFRTRSYEDSRSIYLYYYTV